MDDASKAMRKVQAILRKHDLVLSLKRKAASKAVSLCKTPASPIVKPNMVKPNKSFESLTSLINEIKKSRQMEQKESEPRLVVVDKKKKKKPKVDEREKKTKKKTKLDCMDGV